MDLLNLFKKQQNKQKAIMQNVYSMLAGNWVIMPEDYTTYMDKGFKSIPYVYAIIDQIAEKFSDAPRELVEIVDIKKARGYDTLIKGARNPKDIFMAKMLRIKAFKEVGLDHEFYRLMDKPNPITPTEKTYNYMRCGYLALTGNNYNLEISLDGKSSPKQIHIIPSPTCAPVVGDSLVDPIAGYRISYFDEIIPKEQMQHVKLSNFTNGSYDPIDTLVGMSPLRSLIGTTSQLRDAEKANGLAFANMSPAGIISGEGNDESMTEEQGSEIQDGFENRYFGKESWKKIIVTPAKVSWTRIGFSPVDMDILKFMDKAEERVAKVYHYPLGLLNSQGEVANETINSRRLITDAVLPYIRRFDDADTQSVRRWYKNQSLKVVSDLQYFPELLEDLSKMAKWLGEAYWLTVQEKRAVMDYQEEWTGTMLVPTGLDTIENVTTRIDLDGGDEDTL